MIVTEKRYREKYSLEERTNRAKAFQESQPDKIMIIVQKHPKSNLVSLNNSRFLTLKSFKFAQVKNMIEKKLRDKLDQQTNAKQSFFLFVNGNVANMQDTMQRVYEKYKDLDGILYITYQEQQKF